VPFIGRRRDESSSTCCHTNEIEVGSPCSKQEKSDNLFSGTVHSDFIEAGGS
jgi:hypothetical protein